MKSNEICPVCYKNVRKERFVRFQCYHILCNSCYYEWHIRLNNKKCSICRKEINYNLKKCIYISEIIFNLISLIIVYFICICFLMIKYFFKLYSGKGSFCIYVIGYLIYIIVIV